MVRQEVDRVFGAGFAAQHPELVAIVVQTAASDFAALAIARSLQDIAAALIDDGDPERHGYRLMARRD